MPAKGSTPSSRNASPTGAGARRRAPADMPTAQSRSRGVAPGATAADSGALRAALGETGSWRAQAEALARTLVEGTLASGVPLFDVQRAFAIFPPGSPAGESLFRLAEALPRIPDRPSRAAMLADRVPALRGWKAAAALPFADLATNAIGRQFVYAETVAAALRRAKRDVRASPASRFSFDMLGEGARTDADADRNFRRYIDAIRAMERAVSARAAIWRERLEVSVKLSSIHPRYDAASYAQVRGELLDRLKQIAGRAAAAGIGLTIDAEGSESLPLQLDLFEALAADPALDRWGGLGLAVQAYQLRALGTVDALLEIAGRRRKRGGMPIAVRLVKGAYWDAEVKRAQELGLARYPVFTDKRLTDLSYLACARRLLSGPDSVYPQFATHNPVSLACVLALAHGPDGASAAAARFECQRLHGMGRALYRTLAAMHPDLPVRKYAPVGEKRELLAYLVRRLLENSASTSYVRQAARAKRSDDLLRTAFEFLDAGPRPRDIPLPTELHMPQRRIAKGYDLGDSATLVAWAKSVNEARREWTAGSLVNGERRPGPARPAVSPARPDVTIGEVSEATPDTVRSAVDSAHAARVAWSAVSVPERAAALDRLADLLEADMAGLMALCVWEAGKTLADAMADVREAGAADAAHRIPRCRADPESRDPARRLSSSARRWRHRASSRRRSEDRGRRLHRLHRHCPRHSARSRGARGPDRAADRRDRRTECHDRGLHRAARAGRGCSGGECLPFRRPALQLAARPVPAGGDRARGARHAAGCNGRVAHRRSRRSCDRHRPSYRAACRAPRARSPPAGTG